MYPRRKGREAKRTIDKVETIKQLEEEVACREGELSTCRRITVSERKRRNK